MSMTEKEAIRILKKEKFWETDSRICEAFEMAIEVLEEKRIIKDKSE